MSNWIWNCARIQSIHLNSFPFLRFALLVRANCSKKKLNKNFFITFIQNLCAFHFVSEEWKQFYRFNFLPFFLFSSCQSEWQSRQSQHSQRRFLINVCSNGFCGFLFVWNECSVNLISGNETKRHNSKSRFDIYSCIERIKHSAFTIQQWF